MAMRQTAALNAVNHVPLSRLIRRNQEVPHQSRDYAAGNPLKQNINHCAELIT